MASYMTTKTRKALDEFLDSIEQVALETFIGAPKTRPGKLEHTVDFGSKDFYIMYTGVSDSEPEGRYMFEIRAKKSSSNSSLRMMAQISKDLPQNQKRLAFLLIDENVLPGFHADHIRMAFREGQVWEEGVINKVHVSWVPDIEEWVEYPEAQGAAQWEPRLPANWPANKPPLVFKKIPFERFNEDGTKSSGPGKKSSGSKK